MTFDEWWLEFTSVHPDWRYADSEALRKAAFESGAASRDAEVVSLTNQRDYEYVRAENAEQERDQLREELTLARMQNAVVYGTSHPEIYKTKEDELRKDVEMLREALEHHQSQTRPIQKTIEALAATAPKEEWK